jgi:hypothetical protein
MSYQEKRTILTILSGTIIFVIYTIYAITSYKNQVNLLDDMTFWAKTMLIFIGIGIVVTIILQILFHIGFSIAIAIKEKKSNPDTDHEALEKIIKARMVTDEMDKLVELKSMRIGFMSAGIGFVWGLITILFNYPPAVMINIIFASFLLGSIFEGVAQLFFYRRGIKHG